MAGERQRVCVFCGSSMGVNPKFEEAASSLGRALAEAKIELVYGAGTRGLMGATAKACFLQGGNVHGIIPKAMHRRERNGTDQSMPEEIISPVSSEGAPSGSRSVITTVESMHERKKLMADLSAAFLVLPGGYGTLEVCERLKREDNLMGVQELAEMTTWTQLGIHRKPVILLNVAGFYTPLRSFVRGAVEAGFIAPANESFLTVIDDPGNGDFGAAALEALATWKTNGQAYGYEWKGKE